FTDLMTGGWDLAKNVKRDTQFGPTPKIAFLQRLAWTMHEAGRREIEDTSIPSIFPKLGSIFEQKGKVLLQEILEAGLLARMGVSYSFSHLSFQEFFAARDLLGPSPLRATEILSRYLRGEDW